MSIQTTAPFIWKEIALSEVVFVDGVPHTTRRAIGEWLEYADPQKAIDNILARNPHLEIHTIPLNLRGMDGVRDYETSVFHPIGFLLIVMESGQPRAHAMKAAVAEFVWRYAGPRTLSFKEVAELRKQRAALFAQLERCRDSFVLEGLMHDLREVSLDLGSPVPAENLLGANPRQKALPGV